jgi:hypothetical protein
MSPKNAGRLLTRTVCAIVTSAPVKIPALPRPATARPTIKAVDVGARAQTRDPTSKMKTAMRRTHLTLKME